MIHFAVFFCHVDKTKKALSFDRAFNIFYGNVYYSLTTFLKPMMECSLSLTLM